MAIDTKGQTASTVPSVKTDAMSVARMARTKKDPNAPILTGKQKFMLSQVRQAAKACKLMAEILSQGQDLSPQAAIACGTLSSEYIAAMSVPAK